MDQIRELFDKIITLWRSRFGAAGPVGKLGIGCATLLLACCMCSVPVAILSPDREPELETAVNERSQEIALEEELEPTNTAEAEPTKTKRPTQTPRPTSTPLPEPTNTPRPTATEIPPTETPSNEQMGTVVSITDGDTFHVLIDGEEYAVRLIGIDTPEKDEVCGLEARKALGDLIQGAEIRLVKDVSEVDRFDRLLRYVYVDDLFVNAEMVENGYAEAVEYPPDTAQADFLADAGLHALPPSCQTLAAVVPTEVLPTATVPAPTAEPLPTTVPAPTEPPPTAEPQPTTAPAPTDLPPTAEPQPTSVPAPTEPPPTQAPEPTQSAVVASIGNVIIVGVNKAAEYVDIRNNGDTTIDLGGWTLISEKGDQACDLGSQIAPGVVLRIWARAEDAGQGGFNCNFGSNIWNNNEPDPAVLKDPTGAEVSRW
jgi:micrococcal nuclease